MDEFLNQVRDAIAHLDSCAKVEGNNLVVLGCTFPCYHTARGTAMWFCNGNFSRRANGTYDIARAIRRLLKQLPSAIAKRDAMVAERAAAATMQEFVRMFSPDAVYHAGMWCKILDAVHVRKSDDGYLLHIRAEDIAHMGAILDALQETGLIK